MIALVAAKAAWTLLVSVAWVIFAVSDHETATALVPLYVLAVLSPVVLPGCVSTLRRDRHTYR